MNAVEITKESNCNICGKPRKLYHATTWGVAGAQLGCNKYFTCPTCTAEGNYRVEKTMLMPCTEKHTQSAKN